MVRNKAKRQSKEKRNSTSISRLTLSSNPHAKDFWGTSLPIKLERWTSHCQTCDFYRSNLQKSQNLFEAIKCESACVVASSVIRTQLQVFCSEVRGIFTIVQIQQTNAKKWYMFDQCAHPWRSRWMPNNEGLFTASASLQRVAYSVEHTHLDSSAKKAVAVEPDLVHLRK